MHKIKLIEHRRLSVILDIDGAQVELTKRMNKLSQSSNNDLSQIIDSIECAIKNHEPLRSFSDILNRTNILRILESLFFDITYELWQEEYSKQYANGNQDFIGIFTAVFGFRPPAHMKVNSLVDKMHRFSKKYKEELSIEKYHISSDQYTINQLNADGNIITYDINGQTISMCSSGHTNIQSAKNVLLSLNILRDGFRTKSSEKLKRGINMVGPKAAASIIETFFYIEAKEYFCEFIPNQAIISRNKFHPRKVIKEYFSTTRHPFFNNILNGMEEKIQEVDDSLIESSKQEIYSDENEWTLYLRGLNGAHQYTLKFIGAPILIKECQQYLRLIAEAKISSGQSFAKSLYTIYLSISHGINVLCNKLNIRISSISELNPLSVRALNAYLLQKSGYSLEAQRRILIYLRALYDFISCSGEEKIDPFDGLKIPDHSKNITIPTSQKLLSEIVKNLSLLPKEVELAFLTACSVGARAKSICSLTVDKLYYEDGGYKLKVSYDKTATRRRISGEPDCIIHKIQEGLASKLIAYIKETEDLRSKIKKPYIFVYSISNYREGTHRQPRILSAQRFKNEMDKLLNSLDLYDGNGQRISCSFKTIRAEVGRALFSAGASENDVAHKLGNSPVVARKHYHYEYPEEEANRYNEQYATIENSVRNEIAKIRGSDIASMDRHTVLYGYCNKGACHIKNDCTSCPQRIICNDLIDGGKPL